MSRKPTACVLTGLVLYCFTLSPTAFGQGAVLDELYGQGVHSYFGGRYSEASEMFTNAIAQGSKDPRCYYFRGLCHIRLGHSSAAGVDFEKGADLEITGRDRIYPIGRSLQRIQGRDRLLLEKHRRQARIAAQIAARKEQQARFEELKRVEPDVVRDPNRAPAERPAEMTPPPPAGADDPFLADESEPSPAPPREAPADTPPPAAEAAPADPAPATPATPAESDPFGAEPSDDPFSTDAPATDDPFAPSDSPATPPANDDPFGDPFGG